MADIAGSYISIDRSNITNKKSKVRQLVDIVQLDIASTDSNSTRKSYEVFVSGVSDQNITSSLYQTVFDQSFALGTANPLFDITIGSLLEESGSTLTVNGISSGLSRDAGGKIIGFNSDGSNPMMREKINVYRQFAQNLLGDADAAFFLPHSATAEAEGLNDAGRKTGTLAKKIKGAVFICFRRLFTRDNIHKGSFGLKLHKSAVRTYSDFLGTDSTGTAKTNLDSEVTDSLASSESNTLYVIDDALSATNLTISPIAGEVSTLKDASGNHVGVIFYDSGIIVLDAERSFDVDQLIRGVINSVSTADAFLGGADRDDEKFVAYGKINSGDPLKYFYPVYLNQNTANDRTRLGGGSANFSVFLEEGDANTNIAIPLYMPNTLPSTSSTTSGTETRPSALDLKYPLLVTGSNIVGSSDYYTSVTNGSHKIPSGSSLLNDSFYPGLWTSGTIDEVLDHICTTRFGRGNNSSMTFRNETFINSSFIFCRAAPTQLNYSTNPTYTDDKGDIVAIDKDTNDTFSYVTTIGLYDAAGELLAVAKTSRPIEKNPETDLSIRIRLDY